MERFCALTVTVSSFKCTDHQVFSVPVQDKVQSEFSYVIIVICSINTDNVRMDFYLF